MRVFASIFLLLTIYLAAHDFWPPPFPVNLNQLQPSAVRDSPIVRDLLARPAPHNLDEYDEILAYMVVLPVDDERKGLQNYVERRVWMKMLGLSEDVPATSVAAAAQLGGDGKPSLDEVRQRLFDHTISVAVDRQSTRPGFLFNPNTRVRVDPGIWSTYRDRSDMSNVTFREFNYGIRVVLRNIGSQPLWIARVAVQNSSADSAEFDCDVSGDTGSHLPLQPGSSRDLWCHSMALRVQPEMLAARFAAPLHINLYSSRIKFLRLNRSVTGLRSFISYPFNREGVVGGANSDLSKMSCTRRGTCRAVWFSARNVHAAQIAWVILVLSGLLLSRRSAERTITYALSAAVLTPMLVAAGWSALGLGRVANSATLLPGVLWLSVGVPFAAAMALTERVKRAPVAGELETSVSGQASTVNSSGRVVATVSLVGLLVLFVLGASVIALVMYALTHWGGR